MAAKHRHTCSGILAPPPPPPEDFALPEPMLLIENHTLIHFDCFRSAMDVALLDEHFSDGIRVASGTRDRSVTAGLPSSVARRLQLPVRR